MTMRAWRLRWFVLGWLALAVPMAALSPLWVRLVAGLISLAVTVWWVSAAGSILKRSTAMLAETQMDRTGYQARWGAAAGQLVLKLRERERLGPDLRNCAEIQERVLNGLGTILENAALIQEDLSELSLAMDGAQAGRAKTAAGLKQALASMARACEAKLAAASKEVGRLAAEGDRYQRECEACRAAIADAGGALTAETASGEMLVASVEATLGTWLQPAKEIGQAVQVATDLAEQTKILGVNASIEALRSGEAGRGFMLVAEEAERLSDRMLRVVHQIASQVKESEKMTAKITGGLVEVRTCFGRLGQMISEMAGCPRGLAVPAPSVPGEAENYMGGGGVEPGAPEYLDPDMPDQADRFDTGPMHEAMDATAKLFATAGELAVDSRALWAKISSLIQAAQGLEEVAAAAEEMGYGLASIGK